MEAPGAVALVCERPQVQHASTRAGVGQQPRGRPVARLREAGVHGAVGLLCDVDEAVAFVQRRGPAAIHWRLAVAGAHFPTAGEVNPKHLNRRDLRRPRRGSEQQQDS